MAMILNSVTDTGLDWLFTALTIVILLWLVIRSKPIPKGLYLTPYQLGCLFEGLRLPPGPPRNLIFGNAADIPKHHEWETYTQWAKVYGDLVYVKVLGQQIVLVNSRTVAQDLFEKRSSIYSDRFDFPMLVDLMGFDWHFVTMRYGEKWRRHRRLSHQKFHPGEVIAYHQIQTRHARELVRRLHKSADDFISHIRHLSGAIIMEVIYGIKVLPKGDPYVQVAEKAFEAGAQATNPGSFLVEALPILKYVPEWVPGAGFKKKARIWRETITKMPTVPFLAVKEALSMGKAQPSFTADYLEQISRQRDVLPHEEEAIRNVAASTYGAGADTTTVALNWFMIAMILYPEVQRKAQAEIDSVIGMDRLPEFEDRVNLPYIDALCKEIQRWKTVFPLGIAHGLIRDDVYGHLFIPKGTIVVGNAWAMLHDEKVYGPNPDQFDPSRFLNPGVPDSTVAFGFGRRICPGRYFADNTIFIAVSSILQVFDLLHATDDNGNQIPVDLSCSSGTISRPDPFQCAIKTRSASAEKLILESATEL